VDPLAFGMVAGRAVVRHVVNETAGNPRADAAQISNGIQNGSRVDGTLGGVGGSLDVLGMVIDPLGSLVAWGVSWLMEHVRPLRRVPGQRRRTSGRRRHPPDETPDHPCVVGRGSALERYASAAS
jgi:hypothetical protein